MTWLLTWTTYGSWLPGDPRGFVSGVRAADGSTAVFNVPGTAYEADSPKLARYAASLMRQQPVLLTEGQAVGVSEQLLETARFRNWTIRVIAVMANHLHLVVEVPDEVESGKLLADFKAYATRRLNRDFNGGRPRIWWTERGSTRILTDDRSVTAAIEYVEHQQYPLVIWPSDPGRPNRDPSASGAA